MKKIELLAPAGNMECFKAAIEAGCDAVYLSGKRFGARSFAGNFSNNEIIEAINYAHLYGVKVYVTINIIVYENEVEDFLNYVRFLHKNNVDAVIIQDIGMMDLLRKTFPNLEIHASTQMNIHNYEAAKLLNDLGIKRVVMARETSIDVIKNIKDNLNIEVETFIHGALCVCYSGQCLMSYLVGGRSGNRGTCAQICRKKYDLYDENNNKLNEDKYLLSTKDLYTLENIDKIIETGVDSLKIEGRMKRKEYVYLVVSIYRKVINNYLKIGKVISSSNNIVKIKLCNDVSIKDGLRFICNEEDYGLVINKMFINNKEVINANKDDVISIKYDFDIPVNSIVVKTTDNIIMENIDDILNTNTRKVLIDVKVTAKLNNKLIISVSDGTNVITKESNIIEQSINRSIDKDLLIKQISKTGNTVYKVNNIDIDMDDNIFINIKDINELRRDTLELLDQKRLYNIPFKEDIYTIDVPSFNTKKEKSILINTLDEYNDIKDSYDVIYTENKELLSNNKVIYKIPRIINKCESYDKPVLVSELGSLTKYKDVITDFSFNVVNSYSVALLHSLEAKKVTLSYELTNNQIEKIVIEYKKRYNCNPNLEVIINSYPEAMVCKFDLPKMYKTSKCYLKDEYGNKYKVESYNEYMKIYNYKKIIIDDSDILYNIGINSLRTN